MSTPAVSDEAVEIGTRALVREEFRQIGYAEVSDEEITRGLAGGVGKVSGDDIRAQVRAALTAALPALTAEATGDEYELQQERMEALYERIADRLGEHDAARNVSEGPSEEQVTILMEPWPVEDLARFIVDDLEYDFIAPIQRDLRAERDAATAEVERLSDASKWHLSGETERLTAERDAARAAVERLKEQVAFIERERDDAQLHAEGVAEGAQIRIDALAAKVAEVGERIALVIERRWTFNGEIEDHAKIAAAIARATLTEGTEGGADHE